MLSVAQPNSGVRFANEPVSAPCASCIALGHKSQSPCSSPVAGHCTCSQSARLDYCNSMLVRLPQHLTQRIQSVRNATARLIFGIHHSEHITGTLICLHWLCVCECLLFKVTVLTYQALDGRSPQYMSSCLTHATSGCRQHDISPQVLNF